MNRRRRHDEQPPARRGRPVKHKPTRLRITSGDMGGRKILYNGDPATRPMKEKTREAVFSLLGGKLNGSFAVDLFGGTGILAFESVSRGASGAAVLEMARDALAMILKNLHELDISDRVTVHNVDTLRWLRHIAANTAAFPVCPWNIFCCPPYRMWKNDTDKLCSGIVELFESAPAGSQLICETELDFDLEEHCPQIQWDIRQYHPAAVGVARKD